MSYGRVSAQEAVARLKTGNQRFVAASAVGVPPELSPKAFEYLPTQRPFAAVIGCSDSRVPLELVFDQGLGAIFAIRVAGNVITPAVTGSAEYAASVLGTRLVVVLGHEGCGAVEATIAEIRRAETQRSPNVAAITGRIRPSVEKLVLFAADAGAAGDLLASAVRANVESSVRQLGVDSPILSDLAANDGLRVVGAVYSIRSGHIEFLPGASDS